MIGTISNPIFENGNVYGDLTVWDGDAISAIEDGSQRELSCGYAYKCDPTPGTTPDGEQYSGVMRNIVFNHVTTTDCARVSGAMVADSAADALQWKQLGDALQTFITSKKEEKKPMLNNKRGHAFVRRFKQLCEGVNPDCIEKDELKRVGISTKLKRADNLAAKAALDAVVPNMGRIGRGEAMMTIGLDGRPQNLPPRRAVDMSSRQKAGFDAMFPSLTRVRP